MFVLTYLRRELRHRSRQAILVAAGLAAGVGLVITTAAASAAVSAAQTEVLHSLYGIGTDITVTARATPSASPSAKTAGAPSASSAGNAHDGADSANLSVGGSGVLDASMVAAILRLPHVAGAAGALILTEISPPPPGSGSIPTTTKIAGIDVTRLGLGPYASATTRTGRSLSPADDGGAAAVDAQYAAAHGLGVGSTITLAGAHLRVVGIVSQAAGGGAADIYLPLALAQELATDQHAHPLTGKVSTIYVSAASATDIGLAEAELATLVPSATLTSSRELATAVSGSLASATTLAHDLGTWLTAGVLLATVTAASLLTLASVTRRIRELGTLKAMGWASRRIVAQIMAESLTVGLAGAALGIAAGYAGVALVNAIAPTLTAAVDDATSAGQHPLTVHLHAHTDPGTVAAATLLALAAALTAGALAAWRAARLRPAHALAQIE